MLSKSPNQDPELIRESLLFACRFVLANLDKAAEILMPNENWEPEEIGVLMDRYLGLEEMLKDTHSYIFRFFIDHYINKDLFFSFSLSPSISPSASPSPEPEGEKE